MTKSNRLIHLERELSVLGYTKALSALDLVVSEMNSENGYSRHDGSHYYYHLVDVTQMLLNFNIKHDEVVLIAALLHDFLEDVPHANQEKLTDCFGEDVMQVVQLLTKTPGVSYHHDKQALKQYITQIEGNWRAALIKTADRVHNFQTLKDANLSHRKRQLDETMTYYIPFFKRCRSTYIRFESFYFSAKTNIEPIASEISRYIEDIEHLQVQLQALSKK